jgi:hypothetical protein
MLRPDILLALMPVVAVLRDQHVKYYVCGSVASSYYGMARSTTDIDLVAHMLPHHAAPFAAALRTDYFVSEPMILEAIARRSCFNLIHHRTCLKVDVFAVRNRPYDRGIMERVRDKPFDEMVPTLRFSLLSPEDTILPKLELCRLADGIPERHWFDVIGVMKVNQHSLDRSYLDKWAGELGVADLLARAWKEVEGYPT